MKIRHVRNGGVVVCDDAVGAELIKGSLWEKAEKPAPAPKKTAARKAAPKTTKVANDGE